MPQPIESLDRRAKWWLLIVSALTIVVLAAAALRENFFADWYVYQGKYAQILDDKAIDPQGRAIADQFSVCIAQNVLPDLGRIDRCVTCHAGVDDPRMVDQPQPFTTHPGNYLRIHDPSTFGCSICHQGQGRATEIDDAHGRVAHWDYPLLDKRHEKTACSRCHADQELYSDAGLMFRADAPTASKASGRLVLEGKRLTEEKGCLGCHTLWGRGGLLGPDITHVGDKTRHELDFSHFDPHEPREIEYWLKKHFLEPSEISPGTLMPDLGLSESEAEGLTAYMLSLRRKVVPAAYRPLASRAKVVGAGVLSGRELYSMNCSSCHGDDGRESEVPGIRTPALSNVDALATASDDYYRQIISTGRSGTAMPSWGPGGGNLSVDEIDRIVSYIRGWEPEGADVSSVSSSAGDPNHGKSYYDGLCGNCHGITGDGGIGTAISSTTFLAIASDRFLADTIVNGRPGTAMASWRQLSTQAVSDILAFIRTWQPEPPSYDAVRSAMRPASAGTQNRNGRILYGGRCASCHGKEGEGGIGPSLNSRDLLRVVDDRYLFRAVVEGRPGTGMPAWRHLNAEQVAAILTYIRSWQPGEKLTIEAAPPTGNYALGEVHYRTSCLQCHGEGGVGGVGPQLVNPVLLSSASDDVLFHWIGHGRTGSAMRGFLAEEHGPTRMTREHISDVIAYLRHLGTGATPPPLRTSNGDANVGRAIFQGTCAGCHGTHGEGSSGPQLNNPVFLRSVSDGFLAATMTLGRMGTSMQPMVHGLEGLGQVPARQIYDVIAYLRLWETPAERRRSRPVAEMSTRSIAHGKTMYRQFCSGCHGTTGRGVSDGEGFYAPALNNPEFLDAASDGFLLATIARGRSRTPMRPFGAGAGGIVSMKPEEINDIVSFLRTWQE